MKGNRGGAEGSILRSGGGEFVDAVVEYKLMNNNPVKVTLSNIRSFPSSGDITWEQEQ